MRTSPKWTVERLRGLKGRRFACLTAYDFAIARLIDEAGFPLVLVGDSLGMTVLGYETTLPVTMEEMLHHTAAVVRGVRRALVVADMPFMSYQASVVEAVANAGRFLKKAGADAVKIEGGRLRVRTVRAMVDNGIPVMGHVGLLPQNVRAMSGYKVQGRTAETADALREDALALQEAGVFSLVLEGMPLAVARAITEAVAVPTIGIGAGPHCDGQILVLNDLLGLSGNFAPRFVRRYADLAKTLRAAFSRYRRDVEAGRFPQRRHCY